MAWPDKLKLNKQLIRSAIELGYLNPKEIQQKTLLRIFGGQDVIAVGPEGCGKTTTYILSVLNRLKYTAEGVPNVLVLVPAKEQVLVVIEQFERLNKNKSLLIVGLYAAPGTETQMNSLADGADIVVATPDRARSIYLKLGLNLNKIELFIVDDADLIIKQGLQLQVAELANSITKCQRLVFTEVLHDKLARMIDPFMKMPAVIEVSETAGSVTHIHPQVLYHVPDFGTKMNLVSLFMQDEELFTKVVIFVNSSLTGEKVCKNLQNRLKNTVSILHNADANQLEEFKDSAVARALIVSNEDDLTGDWKGIPVLLHFELPVDKETFITRVVNVGDKRDETIAVAFATDLELSMVKKIEQATGEKFSIAELPENLVIKKEKTVLAAENKPKTKAIVRPAGEAFHQKKASNSKISNYGAGVKAKMNKKR